MAKSYKKGSDYKLYYMSGGSWASPTWSEVKAVGDITVNPDYAEIEVPERGTDTGFLQGAGTPVFSFPLFVDTGDTSVTAIIDARFSGSMIVVAVANGAIATSGTKYYKMESLVTGSEAANRGDVAQWDIELKRHANSDNTITRVTVA